MCVCRRVCAWGVYVCVWGVRVGDLTEATLHKRGVELCWAGKQCHLFPCLSVREERAVDSNDGIRQ